MVCESENITYKEAARDFELKLEQVMTSSLRLNKRSPWFITVHTLLQKVGYDSQKFASFDPLPSNTNLSYVLDLIS